VGERLIMDAELDYYATSGPMTDLSSHGTLVAGLPADPLRLSEIVRGLLVHNSVVALRGMKLPPERLGDMKRTGAVSVIDGILDLDPSALDAKRPIERRMVGFCYHFALLHCALLRSKHIPSRTRCGFAGYFRPGRWIDHWVVEYWDGECWRLHDTQLGRDGLSGADFQDGFVAWDRCRSAVVDPLHYGNEVFWGWDELRGSLINDLGALNKIEVGGWKWCDLIAVDPIDQPHADVDTRLEEFTTLVADADSLAELRHAFQNDPAVQPPAGVTND
jgi:Transglutaminase-like superfamily